MAITKDTEYWTMDGCWSFDEAIKICKEWEKADNGKAILFMYIHTDNGDILWYKNLAGAVPFEHEFNNAHKFFKEEKKNDIK